MINTLSRYWQRVPLVIRAIVTGYLVFAIAGTLAWTVVLAFIPAPWSLLVMAGVLWVYWKYFSGSWWPKSTSQARRRYFRATRLSREVWKWGLLAALLGVVVLQASFVVVFRIVEFPAETWALGYDFSGAPLWLTWLFLIMASLVASITEEVGFRGYMQVPLEERYGPVAGITIVSLGFAVLHLNQAWAPPVLIPLFGISVIWGILAYSSGSLILAMISHAAADIFNFSYWWTNVAGEFTQRPISETGMDAHFVIWGLILVASIALFSWAARKTLAARTENTS